MVAYGGLQEDKSTPNFSTKVSFSTKKYTFGSVHDSDHDGIVRIFVVTAKSLIIYIIYITQDNFLYTRNAITRHNIFVC